jgi:isoleucyl-tRNA synthetase
MAPILSFLSEEVYEHLPESSVYDKKTSVFLEDYPEINKTFENQNVIEDYDTLFELRSTVSKALEEMRADKKLKGSLEAKVIVPGSILPENLWNEYGEHMAEFLIVSQVDYASSSKELDVGLAEGEKCPRCWHIEDLKEHKCGERICTRCAKVMDEIL